MDSILDFKCDKLYTFFVNKRILFNTQKGGRLMLGNLSRKALICQIKLSGEFHFIISSLTEVCTKIISQDSVLGFD